MGGFLKSPSRRQTSQTLRSPVITAARITSAILEWKVCLNFQASVLIFIWNHTFIHGFQVFDDPKGFTTFISHLSRSEKVDDFMIESSQMSCWTLPLVIRQQNLRFVTWLTIAICRLPPSLSIQVVTDLSAVQFRIPANFKFAFLSNYLCKIILLNKLGKKIKHVTLDILSRINYVF